MHYPVVNPGHLNSVPLATAFPTNPANGQEFDIAGNTWVFNGNAWNWYAHSYTYSYDNKTSWLMWLIFAGVAFFVGRKFLKRLKLI